MLLKKSFDNEYTQVKINTKFGKFNIRVYADLPNKETVVLWTDNVDINAPVLMRVHSECLTGDVIGSLQCDCGDQLERALFRVQKEEGIVIYLRQEGRGIGLFEKIKAYQLQSKGLDTFEANVRLGHKPDARTYEFVKIALDDLGVKSIRLLTNNPSKVSEIAKLGIQVVERVPLVVEANVHNARYSSTKRDKFQHFLDGNRRQYFYQFPLSEVSQVEDIAKYVDGKKRDPLLNLHVAIAASHATLKSQEALLKISAMLTSCEQHGFTPVLHYSFKASEDCFADIEEIRQRLPAVKHLQLNDVNSLAEKTHIVATCDDYQLYLPLSDTDFDMVNNDVLRKIIKKKDVFMVLDNSNGRGISATKEALMEKADVLLTYGMNNISLCGGFGPDRLANYFEMRRYYRINFSIDAEKWLKEGDTIDLDKVKRYLFQLLRFDDPDPSAIERLRGYVNNGQGSASSSFPDVNNASAAQTENVVAVHSPVLSWFITGISTAIKDAKSHCQIGWGGGEFCSHVSHGQSTRHTVVIDTYRSIPAGERFDCISWLLPFGYLDPGVSITTAESLVFDPGYASIWQFFINAPLYLKDGGKLLLGFSPDLGKEDLLLALAQEAGINLQLLDATVSVEVIPARYKLFEGIINDKN